MATTLINATGFLHGVEVAEVGVNCEGFTVAYRPEWIDYKVNIAGEVTGKAVAPTMSTISLNGEISGATGWMAGTFIAAIVPTNDIDGFGQTAGGVYMTQATVTQARGQGGWRKLSIEAERHSGLA